MQSCVEDMEIELVQIEIMVATCRFRLPHSVPKSCVQTAENNVAPIACCSSCHVPESREQSPGSRIPDSKKPKPLTSFFTPFFFGGQLWGSIPFFYLLRKRENERLTKIVFTKKSQTWNKKFQVRGSRVPDPGNYNIGSIWDRQIMVNSGMERLPIFRRGILI